MKEMVGGCCVCSDERGWPENPLVYCDGSNCTVAVHQACYGIVTVPTGPWYCRKCESQERSARVRCELCPSRDGALKKTDNASWAHVVCALYIPEVRFGNVTTMEPIILQLIPAERYAKNCYICQEMGKGSRANVGACMQCNKTGCRMQFHVTCAQALGLLCEEAGNYLDNVKYCGYCQYHYSKLKKGGNVKTIPPYKPITHETGSSDSPSSPEKDSEAASVTQGGGAMMTPAQKASQSSTATVSTSALPSVAASKQRKSSSSTKVGVAGAVAAVPAAAPGAVVAAPQMPVALAGAATTPPIASGSAVAAATKTSSSGGGGSKEKDKHSRSANKTSGSKEKDFRESKSKSSSKSQLKEEFPLVMAGGHKSSTGMDFKGGDKGVLVSTPTTTKSSSIIAPSILQSSKELMNTAAKDATGKFTTSNFTESVVVNSESVFGSDNSKGSTSSTSSTVAKKRKADGKNSVEDANNPAYVSFCRDLIKDVSVTLIPLSSVDKLDLGEVKKVRTESTSSPALQAANEANPLMSATLSLSKSQPLVVQPSIIKPPIIKDVGELTRVQSAVSPFAAAAAPELQPTTTQSIRVSVPLSTASVAGINLPTNNNSTGNASLMSPAMPSTSTSHGSLFQQAIHNRSVEQMGGGGFAMGRLGTPQPPPQRSSPIVQVPAAAHQNVILPVMERQSPLIQAAVSPLMAPEPPVSVAMQNLSPHGIHSQILTSANVAAVHQSDSGMLKITYEKQPAPRQTPTPVQEEVTGRRSSHAGHNHSDFMGGGGGGGFVTEQPQVAAAKVRVAAARGQNETPPPPHSTARTPDTSTNFTAGASFGGLKFSYESQPGTSGAAAVTPIVAKDSPPSSPGSEAGVGRKRSRKASEAKELKIFQNGIHVTHMLGNQLNPASSVAQKMSDQLHMEIEAHSVYTAPAMDTSPQLVGPPFPGGGGKPYSSKPTASQQGPPSLTTMLGAGSGSSSGSGTTPQSLEQLLERQWEQGSQFLMEQAQHFDIASLLSCLHQLQTENVRLEEHVNNLVARRDHLLAVNARLAIPLANPNPGTSQVQFNSMSVNGPSEAAVVSAGRTSRSSAAQSFGVPTSQQPPAPPSQAPLQQMPVENGVDFRHSAVSAVTITPHQPPSGGTVRHSPVTQPFVGQAAAAGVRQPGGPDSSRSRPTAGGNVFQAAQQTTSSYQKLALLQQQQQQAQIIRRDDGQVKPS